MRSWLYAMLVWIRGEHVEDIDDAPGSHGYQNSIDSTHEVDTRKLTVLLQDWIDRVLQEPEDTRAETNARIDSYLEIVYQTVDMLSQQTLDNIFDLSPSIMRPIVYIAQIVDFAKNEIMRVGQHENKIDFSRTGARNWKMYVDLDLIRDEMINNGWCPSEAYRQCDPAVGADALLHVGRMTRFEEVGQHINCTKRECVAFQIDEDSYELRHVANDCSCGLVEIDMDALGEPLKNESYPLLRLTKSGDSVSVEVVQATENTDFCAISHVWADGLGNPRGNALHLCQIQKLEELTTELLQQVLAVLQRLNPDMPEIENVPQLLLWIDTLCCPVYPRDLRKLALQRMEAVYADAHIVLVLDDSLRRLNSEDIRPVEMCARMASSNWARRLWTLQEVTLADELWVQFADKPIMFAHILRESCLLNSAFEPKPGVCLKALAQAATSWISFISNFGRIQTPSIGSVAEALRYRSCSKSSDEALCLVSLLQLDVKEFLNRLGRDEKLCGMTIFWAMLAETSQGVPAQFIFHSRARLSGVGFRWAPASLLGLTEDGATYCYDDYFQNDDHFKAQLHPHGLVVRFPGIRFSYAAPIGVCLKSVWNLNEERIYVRQDADTWFWLSTVGAEHNTPKARETLSLRDILDNRSSSEKVLLVPFPESRSGLLGHLGQVIRHTASAMSFESRAFVLFMPLPSELSTLNEAAFQCACQVRRETIADEISKFETDSDIVDGCKFDDVYDRLIEVMEARAAESIAENRLAIGDSDRLVNRIAALLGDGYATVEREFSEDTLWCVD